MAFWKPVIFVTLSSLIVLLSLLLMLETDFVSWTFLFS